MQFKHATARTGSISIGFRQSFPIDSDGIFEIPDVLMTERLASRFAELGHATPDPELPDPEPGHATPDPELPDPEPPVESNGKKTKDKKR